MAAARDAVAANEVAFHVAISVQDDGALFGIAIAGAEAEQAVAGRTALVNAGGSEGAQRRGEAAGFIGEMLCVAVMVDVGAFAVGDAKAGDQCVVVAPEDHQASNS